MKPSKQILILSTLLLILACDLPHEPGPMPADIVETDFIPGLNIMGVLRADGVAGQSFLNLNRALTTEEIYSDSIENFSPDVDYVRVRQIATGNDHFFMRGADSVIGWDNATFKDTALTALAGESYELEIKAPGFPTLTGQTSIPNKPKITDGSLVQSAGRVSIELQLDPSAHEYKLYLVFMEDALEKVVKPSDAESVKIEWNFSSTSGTPLRIMLTALDENLTRYGNSPISFIPNTYHPDASTVEGGYGCFGSLSVTTIQF